MYPLSWVRGRHRWLPTLSSRRLSVTGLLGWIYEAGTRTIHRIDDGSSCSSALCVQEDRENNLHSVVQVVLIAASGDCKGLR